MVGHLEQPQVLAQLGEVAEHGHDAAVVGLEERLPGQDGKQLVLRVVLARELRRVRRQRLARQAERLAGHRPRRLGHLSCGFHTFWMPLTARGFQQSNIVAMLMEEHYARAGCSRWWA